MFVEAYRPRAPALADFRVSCRALLCTVCFNVFVSGLLLQARFRASFPAKQVASLDLDSTVYAVACVYLCAKKLKVTAPAFVQLQLRSGLIYSCKKGLGRAVVRMNVDARDGE